MISKMIVSFAVVTLLSFCSPASSFAFLPRVSRTDDAVIIDFDGVGYAPSYQGKTLFGQITNPGFVPLPSFNPYYPAMYRQQGQTPNEWSYSYEYPNPLTVGDVIKQTPPAPPVPAAAPTCGAGPAMPATRELTSERIAGGASAKRNAWSFIVALKKTDNKLICSGSLISDSRVLLAAQCLEKLSLYEISTVTVMVGMYKTDQTDVQTTRRISKMFIHSQYNSATYANDIAIIVMDAPVVLARGVATTVCLPAVPADIDTFNDQDAIILGWGGGNADKDGKVTPFDNLQQAKVSIQSNAECKMGDLSKFVLDSTLCIASTNSDKFTCTPDDIGGPVVILSAPGTWSIVGINSYTKDCKTPGLKTRVTAFRTWINTYLTMA